MKKPLERVIYSNYDVFQDYESCARELLVERGNTNPTEQEICDEVQFMDVVEWEDTKQLFSEFFDKDTWILQGTIKCWNGDFEGGFIFKSFSEMFFKAAKDCDFWKIYDENGHLYLECSHHDGTNFFEIKKLTERGIEYLHRWENDYKPYRSEKYIHDKIMRYYSTLPGFANKVLGLPEKEYEPEMETII